MKSTLLLLPNLLGPQQHHELFLPSSVDRAVASLDGLFAESAKEGRAYLKRFNTKHPLQQMPLFIYDEHSTSDEIELLLQPLMEQEQCWGYVSDAGLPCIADPGSKLVQRARQRGITVKAFVGPSAIMLALMLSGLPAQHFCFQGYLDKREEKRAPQIVELEKESLRKKRTQLFIETPYRNMAMLQSLLQNLQESTYLCVAWDLTLPTQSVMTEKVSTWRTMTLPNLDKKPAIFLFSSF